MVARWLGVATPNPQGFLVAAPSETAEDEIDLHGIGRLLALTPNDEVMC